MNNASTHSQAHLQFAQADPQSQNCKRACLFPNAFLPTLKTNFSGAFVLRLRRNINTNNLLTN